MTSNVVLGIDPGLEGAAALLGPDWGSIFDLPTKVDEAFGKRIDCAEFAKKLQQALPADACVQVCIEAVANGGMGKGRTNAFTVASQFWTQSALVNTLELLGLHVDCAVPPVKWKALYGIGGKASADAAATKRRVREIAAKLYPDLAVMLQRQADHNRAEACLLAHYFRKVRA